MSRKTALWSAAILTIAFTFIFGAVLLRSTPGAQAQPDVAPLVQPAAPLVDPAQNQNTSVMTALSSEDETRQHETANSSAQYDKHHHDDEGEDD